MNNDTNTIRGMFPLERDKSEEPLPEMAEEIMHGSGTVQSRSRRLSPSQRQGSKWNESSLRFLREYPKVPLNSI